MQESIVEKSWPAGGISRIKVDSLFGNTRLVGYDGTEIKVSVSGRYYGWQQRAVNRNPLPEQDLFDISLEKEGNALVLKSAPRGLMNWLKTMGLDIRILLPTSKGYDTEIRSEAGSIEITNYLGEVQAGTKAGNITLENVRGEVNARTFAGSVKITDCKAEINVDTAAGNVTALRCEGNLHISTAGGTLRIDQVVGRVFAAATAGNIYASHIDGMLKASTTAGSCKVNNMKGSLGIVANMGNVSAEVLQTGDFLDIETKSGNIRTIFPFDRSMDIQVSGSFIRSPRFPGFTGEFGRDRIIGKTGNGGVQVRIAAASGNVRINDARPNALESFERTFKDTEFTFPAHFFQVNWKGLLLSFAVCLLMIYGFSGVLFFTLEQLYNLEMREVYTGIVLGYFTNAVLSVGLVYLFTRYFADKIRGVFFQYLYLIVSSFVVTIIGQIIIGLAYWQFIAPPDDGVSTRQPLFLYTFIPQIVVAVYFYFWQRSRQMTRKISEQEFELVSLEKLKTKAELDALQARINPHFLYNSLNSIAGLVHEDPDKAEKMTLLLSKLFRFTIGSKDQHYNSVENEVDIARTYLDIEQVRFGNRLSYTIEVEPGLESLQIPRFLLQPLVENAVKHGISKIAETGEIAVKITHQAGELWCSVHDNGPAFPEHIFSGYGLQSIQDKLKLLYAEKAVLDIQNTIYKQVIIRLPC